MSTENQHVFPRKFKFFRVLLLGFSTKLAIPQRLTKYFINENLTSVTLLSPLGKSWNVRIGGNRAGLHFAEGWGRFAAAHGSSFGDLLVFKCVASGVFQVTIFDKSTCEKDYYKVTNIGVAGDDHVPGQGKYYDQEYSECFKGITTTPPSSGQRAPLVMEEESNKDQTQVSVGNEVEKLVHKAKKATYKQMCKRGSRFEITIRPKHMYTMLIPVEFTRSNDLSGVHQMLLRDPEGRSWPINLLHHKKSSRYSLSAGWRHFHIGNKLKDGDVCVFKLKKKNEMLVQIHRSCEEDSSSRSKSPLQQAVQLKRAIILPKKGSPSKITWSSKPVNSAQFRSTIVPTNIGKMGKMNIPRAFLSLVDIFAEKEVVVMDPNSRRWPVKIHHCQKDGRCRMRGGGWVSFCTENGIEVGDICVFSFYYRKKKATFQIEVIKSKDSNRRKL